MNCTTHKFTSWDGVELFYRAWLPVRSANKALLLFHRGHEHSGRWEEFVEMLNLGDVAIFAWDARGHGQSPGARGSAESLMTLVKDTDAFARHVSSAHQIPLENTIIVAHSVGAVTAAAWVHDFAPPIRGMVLATPAFEVKLYIPFAIPLLRLRQRLFGPGHVKSYVKARLLTHDKGEAAHYEADTAIFRQISVNVLLDLFDTSKRLITDAGAITVPTMMLGAGSDWIVKLSAQRKFFERLSSPHKEMKVYPGLYHAIFHERNRQEIVERVRRFVLERFAEPLPSASLMDGDKAGYTKTEYDRLSGPGSPMYGVVRLGMKSLGRLSTGIQLGWLDGFDSGVTLDYVYANRAQGRTPVGRWFDRAYLNGIGWRGIRQRKVNLEKVLRATIQRVHDAGQPVRIVDIAAGAGRYVLETIRDLPDIPITALLRDYKSVNLDAATRLARELGLRKHVSVARGDAFDRDSIAAITPRPTIAIVSGLYELFPDNEPVRNSLRGLAEALEPGRWLIYTNQPWHPQVEFIARVLTNREGRPWIMRRRTQAEMDELVRSAGFEKVSTDIDRWGIFTVSLARRIG
jgi:alpha-beta hydrolase superfamily lysophospholipase